jgi:hypothetical protein
MTDKREAILTRLQACVKTLAPGVVYTFPHGATHRPIESNLDGRCYNKIRTQGRVDATEMPFVEIITADAEDTVREIGDEDIYLAEMPVELWGYVKADDQGDGFDTVVRPVANALRADLIVACEAFPFWTSTEYPDPITRLVGPLGTVLVSQFTEPAIDAPDSFVKVRYAIRYTFSKLNP